MSPKDVDTLLDILEKSSRSPALAHLTTAAMEALKHSRLVVLSADDKAEAEPARAVPRPITRG